MIVAPLSEIAAQAAMSPAMEKAVAWLESVQGQELADGRIEIDGAKVFALVQSYETKDGPDIFWEGHRKYMDFQYLREGREMIGWAPIALASVVREYNSERDMWIASIPDGEWTPVQMRAGYVAILKPTDVHAPMRAAGASMPVKKIVVKVAVEG